jgi:hypothetical protein
MDESKGRDYNRRHKPEVSGRCREDVDEDCTLSHRQTGRLWRKPSQNSLFKADTDLSPWLRAEFWDWFRGQRGRGD